MNVIYQHYLPVFIYNTLIFRNLERVQVGFIVLFKIYLFWSQLLQRPRLSFETVK